MSHKQKRVVVILLNLVLLWGAWYLSGYGVMVGRSGNLGMNCLYLTARGLYDQTELAANSAKRKIPLVDSCAAVYRFDAAIK
jgi:YobH-like protein